MSEENLARAMRAVYDDLTKKAPREHSLRTADCPPLTAFPQGTRQGWSEEYRSHVPSCPYCQKLTAMQWRLDHPRIWYLALHAAGRPVEDAEALRIHLEDDRCAHCLRILRSTALQALAKLIQAGAKTLEGLEARAKRAGACASQLVFAAGFAAKQREPFQMRTDTVDGSLLATLWERDGQLMLELESADPANAGRKVLAEILGEGGEVLRETFVLEDRGEYGAGISRSFGELKQFERLLKECSLVVSWIE